MSQILIGGYKRGKTESLRRFMEELKDYTWVDKGTVFLGYEPEELLTMTPEQVFAMLKEMN